MPLAFTLDWDVTDAVRPMLCPNCAETYLHHGVVEVFDRIEDASVGMHVVISPGGMSERTDPDGRIRFVAHPGRVRVDGDLSGNPSSRRHGLRIFLECETCGGRFALELAQHKGLTLVGIAECRDGRR